MFSEIGIPRLELPDLSLSAPLSIAGPRVSQVRLGDSVKTIGRVVLRGKFQSKGFVMNEALLARRPYGVIVQMRGIAIPPFDPRHLRRHQRGTVFEVCRTVPSPKLERPKMAASGGDVLPAIVAGCRVTCGGVSERAIEHAFDQKHLVGEQTSSATGIREHVFRSN